MGFGMVLSWAMEGMMVTGRGHKLALQATFVQLSKSDMSWQGIWFGLFSDFCHWLLRNKNHLFQTIPKWRNCKNGGWNQHPEEFLKNGRGRAVTKKKDWKNKNNPRKEALKTDNIFQAYQASMCKANTWEYVQHLHFLQPACISAGTRTNWNPVL